MGEGLQLSTLGAHLACQGQGAQVALSSPVMPREATALPPAPVPMGQAAEVPLPSPLFLRFVGDAVPCHELVEDDDSDEHIHLEAQ